MLQLMVEQADPRMSMVVRRRHKNRRESFSVLGLLGETWWVAGEKVKKDRKSKKSNM